jgi:putative PIN family toxin of toxin-antitoxin system
MRAVLDTNILVRANPRAAGAACALLAEFATFREHTLIVSPFLLEEVERVLAYPRLQALWPLTPEEIQEYVGALDELSEMVYPGAAPTVVSADPQDDPVIETALLGQAECLCTLDRHLYAPEVVALLGRHSILVLNDVQLLKRLRSAATTR